MTSANDDNTQDHAADPAAHPTVLIPEEEPAASPAGAEPSFGSAAPHTAGTTKHVTDPGSAFSSLMGESDGADVDDFGIPTVDAASAPAPVSMREDYEVHPQSSGSLADLYARAGRAAPQIIAPRASAWPARHAAPEPQPNLQVGQHPEHHSEPQPELHAEPQFQQQAEPQLEPQAELHAEPQLGPQAEPQPEQAVAPSAELPHESTEVGSSFAAQSLPTWGTEPVADADELPEVPAVSESALAAVHDLAVTEHSSDTADDAAAEESAGSGMSLDPVLAAQAATAVEAIAAAHRSAAVDADNAEEVKAAEATAEADTTESAPSPETAIEEEPAEPTPGTDPGAEAGTNEPAHEEAEAADPVVAAPATEEPEAADPVITTPATEGPEADAPVTPVSSADTYAGSMEDTVVFDAVPSETSPAGEPQTTPTSGETAVASALAEDGFIASSFGSGTPRFNIADAPTTGQVTDEPGFIAPAPKADESGFIAPSSKAGERGFSEPAPSSFAVPGAAAGTAVATGLAAVASTHPGYAGPEPDSADTARSTSTSKDTSAGASGDAGSFTLRFDFGLLLGAASVAMLFDFGPFTQLIRDAVTDRTLETVLEWGVPSLGLLSAILLILGLLLPVGTALSIAVSGLLTVLAVASQLSAGAAATVTYPVALWGAWTLIGCALGFVIPGRVSLDRGRSWSRHPIWMGVIVTILGLALGVGGGAALWALGYLV